MKTTDPFNFDKAALSQMENIRRIGLRRLRNRGEIDDFVQETILRAYAKRGQLRDEAKFDRWVAVIARNLAAEWNRKRREQPIDEIPETPDMRTPHDTLEEAEERQRLHRAMGRLNEDDREMLRARYFDEASYEELQERHGLSYSAVGFRLHRAKARLRKLLTSTAAAFAAAFAGFGRAAWGGILLMTKTTKIAVGAAAVAAGVLIGGYIWINNADDKIDAPNDNPLTIEEQSPRIAPLSNQKSTDSQSATERANRPSEAAEVRGDSTAPAPTSDVESQTADSIGETEPSDAPAPDGEAINDETKSGAEAYEPPMRYRYDGMDIVADVEVPYDLALNGGKVHYKHPDGSMSWTVELPAGSLLKHPKQFLTEEGLGLTDGDKTGDFIISITVAGK